VTIFFSAWVLRIISFLLSIFKDDLFFLLYCVIQLGILSMALKFLYFSFCDEIKSCGYVGTKDYFINNSGVG